MRVQLTLHSLIALAIECSAQWQTLDPGFSRKPRSLCYDYERERLYCFGGFETIGTLEANGAAYLENGVWTAMGTGITNPSVFPIVSSSLIGDSVIVSGFFTAIGGVANTRHTALWNGEDWTSIGGLGSTGIAWGLDKVGSQLIASGAFDEIGGISCNSSAILENGVWNPLCAYPQNSADVSYTCAEVYETKYYLAGNVNGVSNLNDIGRLEDDTLIEIGGGLLGDTWVNDMKVFDGKLWVAGEFYSSAGNAASGLMIWDGTSWANPFPQIIFSTQVHDLVIDGNRLLFSGKCLIPGFPNHYTLGVYEGNHLCLFGKNIDAALSPIAMLSDDKLAVVPNVPGLLVNGETLGRLAVYDLNFPADTCFELNTTAVTSHPAMELWRVRVNGLIHTFELLSIQGTSHPSHVEVCDSWGRLVHLQQIPPLQSNTSFVGSLPHLESGAYSMSIYSAANNQIQHLRFVVTE